MNLRRGAFIGALALGVSVLAACSAASTKDASAPGGSAQNVAVEVEPAAVQLLPGEAVQFASAVTGAAETAVTWAVVESGGGTVDATGLYTAPTVNGTYHVRATSVADSKVHADATVTVTPAAVVAVTVSPSTVGLSVGASLTFRATVTGTTNGAVSWKVSEASGCGSVTQAGVYTAPPSTGTCHVVATSAADATKSARATVTVNAPVAVTVSPATAAADACKPVTFSAKVTGSSDTAVTWKVQEGSAGGTVSTSGVYTAPSTAGTYHVVATSHASAAATAQATVTVSERVLGVAITPTSATVSSGATQQLSATVTTSCGTFAASAR